MIRAAGLLLLLISINHQLAHYSYPSIATHRYYENNFKREIWVIPHTAMRFFQGCEIITTAEAAEMVKLAQYYFVYALTIWLS